jgi:hypothetical protein
MQQANPHTPPPTVMVPVGVLKREGNSKCLLKHALSLDLSLHFLTICCLMNAFPLGVLHKTDQKIEIFPFVTVQPETLKSVCT